LTLSGSNTYTGGTLISSGTLVASNVEALGTGDVTDDATLELNTGGDFINNIGGTGRVEKSGDDNGDWRRHQQRHAGTEHRR
ncbi:autotransporter-associated beta strand repeat-containing protein, partial [Salmonella enterica]|uniref:autotransporter-associated beta strand repeat-containing protein n=1 Tax=Salmonella enterica TaxID=28901 RepID=UPI0011E9FCE2